MSFPTPPPALVAEFQSLAAQDVDVHKLRARIAQLEVENAQLGWHLARARNIAIRLAKRIPALRKQARTARQGVPAC